MFRAPVAYHITVGTYGSRLHGEDRPTVDRNHNTPGTPFLGEDQHRVARERSLMRYTPIVLSVDQQFFIEHETPSICDRGGWVFHCVAAAPDHVHVLLSAEADPKVVRKLLKRWLGEALSSRWPLPDGQSWWAEYGSMKWVLDDRQLQTVLRYIARQRADELHRRNSEPGRPRPGSVDDNRRRPAPEKPD